MGGKEREGRDWSTCNFMNLCSPSFISFSRESIRQLSSVQLRGFYLHFADQGFFMCPVLFNPHNTPKVTEIEIPVWLIPEASLSIYHPN